MEIFEAIYTLRAMRRLKTDPVPEDLVWKVLDAAIRAPSGGNRQPWGFVVVTDADKKRKIGDWYLDGWYKMYGPAREMMMAEPAAARTFRSADHLANHIADVPVLIFATVQTSMASASGAGPNIFPAVQNLMLAARALGLGTTLTTLHKTHEAEVRELLGIPDGVETMAMIPLGWPKGKFGAGPRKPVEEVTHWDSWGAKREPAK
ncbi:MAG: nitroreductase family protein [Chloroflexota bacterium]|nr:nitroreductase family protein [Chloroflexota bacterium]